MSQNLVIPNKDNKVVFVFGGIDLTLATNIVVNFGAETYQLSDPEVTVESATDLSLDLSGTAEVGKIFATVTYIDGASVNGTDITSRELGNSDKIVVAIGTQLIVEDGTIVAGANSYVTDDEFKAFADSQNYSVPATQPDREALLMKAYSHITLTYEQQLQGQRVSVNQTGSMPRKYVYAYGFSVPSDSIPNDFKNAQMLAALSINEGAETNGFRSDPALKSFDVKDVYSETYQDGARSVTNAQMPTVSAALRPYTKAGAGQGGLYRENMGYIY